MPGKTVHTLEYRADTDPATRGIQGLRSDIRNMARSHGEHLRAIRGGWANLKAGIDLVTGAVRGVVGLFADLAREAQHQQQVLQDTANALAMHGTAWEDASARVNEWAADIQRATGIGDDASEQLLASMASMTAGAGLELEELLRMTTLVQDATADGARSVQQVQRAMARMVEGDMAGLIRVFPALRSELEEISASGGGAAEAMELLEGQFGGLAAQVDPLTRDIGRLENGWGDLREAIGGVFMQALRSSGVVGELADGVDSMAESVGDADSAMGNLVRTGFSAIITGTTYLMQALLQVSRGLNWIVGGIQDIIATSAQLIQATETWTTGDAAADVYDRSVAMSQMLREIDRAKNIGVSHQETVEILQSGRYGANEGATGIGEGVWYTTYSGSEMLGGYQGDTLHELEQYLNRRIEQNQAEFEGAGRRYEAAASLLSDMEREEAEREAAQAQRDQLLSDLSSGAGDIRERMLASLQGDSKFELPGGGPGGGGGGGGGGRGSGGTAEEVSDIASAVEWLTSSLVALDEAAGEAQRGPLEWLFDAFSANAGMLKTYDGPLKAAAGEKEGPPLPEPPGPSLAEELGLQTLTEGVESGLAGTLTAFAEFAGSARATFSDLGEDLEKILGGVLGGMGESLLDATISAGVAGSMGLGPFAAFTGLAMLLLTAASAMGDSTASATTPRAASADVYTAVLGSGDTEARNIDYSISAGGRFGSREDANSRTVLAGLQRGMATGEVLIL